MFFYVYTCISILLCGTALAEFEAFIYKFEVEKIIKDDSPIFHTMPGEEFAKMIGVDYNAPIKRYKADGIKVIQLLEPEKSKRRMQVLDLNGVSMYAWLDLCELPPPNYCSNQHALYGHFIGIPSTPGDFEFWILAQNNTTGEILYREWDQYDVWTTEVTHAHIRENEDYLEMYLTQCLYDFDWGGRPVYNENTYYIGYDDSIDNIINGTIIYQVLYPE